MESKVNFALVGAFVLLLGTLFVGAILWLSSNKSYRTTYDTYQVYMDESVSGLSLDAPVRYRGVQVGGVRAITLAPRNSEQVQLTLDIKRGTPVKEDTLAILRVQGLTGIAHIELSGHSPSAPPLKAATGDQYPVIRTSPSLMLRLDSAVTTLLGNLNRSSERINTLLDDKNRQTMQQTMAHLEQLSAMLAKNSQTIDSGLNQAARAMEGTQRLTTLANAELPKLLQRIHRSADAFDRMTANAARAGVSTAQTAESVRTEALPEARQTLTELRELTASLRRFSETLERNPGLLLQGRAPIPPGPGE